MQDFGIDWLRNGRVINDYLIITNFPNKENKKNAYISKTVGDRAMSMKFLTHRVPLQSSHPNFQKMFVSPKLAAILNFRIFAKIAKHKMLISRKPC